MKDALKKLDKLTQEEVRMAVAQNLKATQAVDDRVKGVDNRVADVNDRVAGVDDRVARVDERIASMARATHVIEDWVRSQEHDVVVDDRVASIDHPVAEIINGAQIIIDYQSGLKNVEIEPCRRKRSKPSHETNPQRCSSSRSFVISRHYQCCPWTLTHHFRNTIAGEHP